MIEKRVISKFGILHMGTKVVYTLYRKLGCAGANVG